MNKIVEQILHTIATAVDAKWVGKLSFVEFAINSSVNASTEKTPFEFVYGQQVRDIINQLDSLHHIKDAQQMVNNISRLAEEAKEKLLKAQENQARYYDKHYHPVEFFVDDRVLLSTKIL